MYSGLTGCVAYTLKHLPASGGGGGLMGGSTLGSGVDQCGCRRGEVSTDDTWRGEAEVEDTLYWYPGGGLARLCTLVGPAPVD